MFTLPDFPVVAPTPTPFDADDKVDFTSLERNVNRWVTTLLSGFVLNSENGEEAFLSEPEKLQIIKCTRNTAAAATVIAGVDSPSVTESLRLSESFADAGANLIRLRIPRLTDNISTYMDEVVAKSPVPVLIINQPAPGMFLSAAANAAVAAELIGEAVHTENCAGYIASADMRFEARLKTFLPDSKHFWTGNGSLLMAGAAIGANGACLMLGNVAPSECREVLRLTSDGKLAEARQIQNRLHDLDFQILSRRAAGVKTALDLLGYECGRPRSPSAECDEVAVAAIRRAMVNAKLI